MSLSILERIAARPKDPDADEIPGGDNLSGQDKEPHQQPSGQGKTTASGVSVVGDRAHGHASPPAQNITSLPQALDAALAFLTRYMRFDNEYQAHICALWACYTYVFEAFDFAPYLFIRSPERGCGKSRLVKCLRCLVPQKPRQVYTANISIASLCYTMHKHRPVVFLEEIDKFFSYGTDDPIVGILNAGWEVGATYDRYNIQLKDNESFNIYGPKCFSGIGNKLDDTTASRSLTIRLNKQSQDDKAAIMREAKAPMEVAKVRDYFDKWARRAVNELQAVAEAVEFPEEMQDGRQRDMCEPLLAIAEMAGEEWKHTARAALVALTSEAEDSSDNTLLLKDIRTIFETYEGKYHDRITTHDLIEELVKLEGEGPWATMWERDVSAGRHMGPSKRMNTMLGEFKISSHNVRLDDGEQKKGFNKADFAKAWKIYCPTEVAREQAQLL